MFWAEFQRLAEAHPYFAWGGLLLFAMFVVHSVCSCVLGIFKAVFPRIDLRQVQSVRLSDRLHRPEASQISEGDDDDEEGEVEEEEEAYGYEEVDEESDVDEDEDEEDDDTDDDDVPRETIWDRLRK